MDHIFPLSHPGVIGPEEPCQFGFASGWVWLHSEGWGVVWGVKENPVGFLVVGSSPGEGIPSPSLGLSHAGRLFPQVLGPLSVAPLAHSPLSPRLSPTSAMFLQHPSVQGCATMMPPGPDMG